MSDKISALPQITPATVTQADLVPIVNRGTTSMIPISSLTAAMLLMPSAAPFYSILGGELGVTATQYPVGNVLRYGAIGNGVANDTSAIAAAKTAALLFGVTLYFPLGTYLTSSPLSYVGACRIRAEPGTRLKLTAAASYVLSINAPANMYGADVRELILDGGGFCPDGLLLVNVISSYFLNIRATNVTVAGFHFGGGGFTQLCTFVNPTCSGNVEAFATTPVNGLLVDGTSSSANTFINPTFEKASGSGMLLKSLINSTFIEGTSEGNGAFGIDCGETVNVGKVCLGNTFIAMDTESNTSGDVVCRLTATQNNFIGCRGFASPAVQVLGGKFNTWTGGAATGFTLDAASQNNDISNVSLYGAGAVIADAGLNNTFRNVYNTSTGVQFADKTLRRRQNAQPANGGTVTVDCALYDYCALTASAAVTAVTVAAPTHAVDGYELTFCVHNSSGGVLTITWTGGAGGFLVAGYVDPTNTNVRTITFKYDANYGFWYTKSVSTSSSGSSGAALAGYAGGAFGLSAAVDVSALIAKVAAHDIVLKANGLA